jgi:hypothetical protein
MKVDRRFVWNEPDRGELRALLDQWKPPAPSEQIERALVRRFRLWRARRLAVPWLAAAAACLALVLVGRWSVRPPASSAPSSPAASRSAGPSVAPPAAAGPSMVPPVPARPPVAARQAPAAPLAGAGRGAVAPGTAPAAVLVEPDQAELLSRLASELRGVRQSPPAAPTPPIQMLPAYSTPPVEPASEAMPAPYQMQWENVGSAWPATRRAL